MMLLVELACTHNFFLCLLLLANAWWCCTLFTLKHEIIMVNVFTFYYFFSYSSSRFPLNYSASDTNFFVCKKNQLNYAKESPPSWLYLKSICVFNLMWIAASHASKLHIVLIIKMCDVVCNLRHEMFALIWKDLHKDIKWATFFISTLLLSLSLFGVKFLHMKIVFIL